jgi:hypothetical protein
LERLSAWKAGSHAGIKQYIGIWDVSAVLSEKAQSLVRSRYPDFLLHRHYLWNSYLYRIRVSLQTRRARPPIGIRSWLPFPTRCSPSLLSLLCSQPLVISPIRNVWKSLASLSYAGVSLVFGTWPVVFNVFNNGIHWVRELFFTLFLLGIDSALLRSRRRLIISVLWDTAVYFEHIFPGAKSPLDCVPRDIASPSSTARTLASISWM